MTAIPAKRMHQGHETTTSTAGEASLLLTKEERARAKKRAKKEEAQEAIRPEFNYDLRGFHGGRQIDIAGLRDFILSLLIDSREANWMLTKNKSAISHVVALLVPGITLETLGLLPRKDTPNMPKAVKPKEGEPVASTSRLPVLEKLFAHYCPTRAPGDKYRMHSALQTFTSVPLTAQQKAKRDKEAKEARTRPAEVVDYLLSPEAMFEACYPLPSYPIEGRPCATEPPAPFLRWQRADGQIEPPRNAGKEGPPKLFGVDCEMVVTEGGKSELARVSIINEADEVVYDALVMPEKPIIDYATQWSGITAKRLEGVTTRLVDVQEKLSELFDYNTILAGHSLDCDLRVLKLAHPWVVDTSVAYHHTRGPPFKPSLKWLSQRWLKRDIQMPKELDAEVVGHDSAEDARAAVDLIKLKLENGRGFGEFASDQESIFERIARHSSQKTTAVVDHGQPAQWHGSKATTAIACQRDEEVIGGVINAAQEHDFVFGRMLELSHALNWSQPSNAVLRQAAVAQPIDDPAPDSTGSTASPSDSLTTAYATLNDRLSRLHASLPNRTALILFTGHSDPRALGLLTTKKSNFDRLWKARQTLPTETIDSITTGEARWTEQDERDLQAELDRARQGLSFFCVKKPE